jgi:hypothetical protein
MADPLKQIPAKKHGKPCPPKGRNSFDALSFFDSSPVFVKPINGVQPHGKAREE